MTTHILGGGTYSPVANHFSLCAPAFGGTAKKLHEMLGGKLWLTKMADPNSDLITNKDVEELLDKIVAEEQTKIIVLNVAFCDYEYPNGDFHGERFKTENGGISLDLRPAEKIIDKIRRKRPDIFLVGFKTTTNKSVMEQFLSGLKMMKRSKCNLVLANDTVTRSNIIITPEESYYGNTIDRSAALHELVTMILTRSAGTFNRTIFQEQESISIDETPKSFRNILSWVIASGGYLENNGNGFTPGHFCYRLNDHSFLSSQRKANHTLVFQEGMTKVVVGNEEKFYAYGRRKPSVGARSQWTLLQAHPDLDCIIHTHNPLKPNSKIPVALQKPYQCGSLQCGLNTLNNLQDFDGIKAVYLDKHGTNIMFSSKDDEAKIINFIRANIQLGEKTI